MKRGIKGRVKRRRKMEKVRRKDKKLTRPRSRKQ
jgi:hypothetical protein